MSAVFAALAGVSAILMVVGVLMRVVFERSMSVRDGAALIAAFAGILYGLFVEPASASSRVLTIMCTVLMWLIVGRDDDRQRQSRTGETNRSAKRENSRLAICMRAMLFASGAGQ